MKLERTEDGRPMIRLGNAPEGAMVSAENSTGGIPQTGRPAWLTYWDERSTDPGGSPVYHPMEYVNEYDELHLAGFAARMERDL